VSKNNLTIGLFGVTLFWSAAMMFALQPMVGRMLLPLVGGTPAGWIVAMAFFQVMLLVGYLYAHFLSRFAPRMHGLLFILALLLGCLFLPVQMKSGGFTGTPGAFDAFMLLTFSLAVPFIALSATSSTLQRLFTATGHPSARDPYFLYAASNLGSFVGLFLYPLVFERIWGLSQQSAYWYGCYGILITATLACLMLSGKKAEEKKAETGAPVTNKQRLGWVLLAFFPSSLLSGVTTHISTDIFSAPMLWVLPLALYLLTFVAAFSRRQPLSFDFIAKFHPVMVIITVGMLLMYTSAIRVSWLVMGVHLLAFGATALMCHTRLARQRPPGEGRNVTEFYLMMSVGGALGGILNAFIAPAVLDRLLEYPLVLVLSCLANPSFTAALPRRSKPFILAGFALMAGYAAFGMLKWDTFAGSSRDAGFYMMMIDLLLVCIVLLLSINVRAVFAGALVLLFLAEAVMPRDVVMTSRNFYGVIKVFDRPMQIGRHAETVRYMYHGTTTHGTQILGDRHRKTITAYYTRGGAIGDIFNLYNPRDIAVIGLGAGTLNCYSTPDNAFTFYEIDPGVVDVARNDRLFTFLSACKGRRAPEIVLGDGRLELARSTASYDLIMLDAFSSDTIPTHLLTLEAMKQYLERLNAGGILLFNLSNRYFDLGPVIVRNAEALGLKSRIVLDIPGENLPYATPSRWVALGRPGVSMEPLSDMGWLKLPVDQKRLWTDDYSDLLGALIR
jgi:hypothetical protein